MCGGGREEVWVCTGLIGEEVWVCTGLIGDYKVDKLAGYCMGCWVRYVCDV